MTDAQAKARFVYGSFRQAQQQLAQLEPFDYFLSERLCRAMGQADNQVLAHLLMLLSASVRDGHSCLPLAVAAKQRWGLAIDEENIITHQGYTFPGEQVLRQQLQALDWSADALQPLVFEHDRLYLRRFYQFERQLSEDIARCLAPVQGYDTQQVKACLTPLFADADSKEIDWQQVAVANALKQNFSLLAGGPGTGKTYTVTKLLAALIQLHQQHNGANAKPLAIAMVAPTGKAAQRLSESIAKAIAQFRGQLPARVLDAIPLTAQTIHRLLGVLPNSPFFRHNRQNPLNCDVLLIDEASMVDLALMSRVFQALPAQCRVILLGDADQLPSVLTGNVLADIAVRPHPGYSEQNCRYLASVLSCQGVKAAKGNAVDYVTFLLKSRRFDGEGGIGQLAKRVIAGQALESWQLLEASVESESALQLLDDDVERWLTPLVQHYYLPVFSCAEVADALALLVKFRVLCATRQGAYSVDYFNEQVRLILSRCGAIDSQDELFHGMPIMIAENHYGLGLFNGDIGMIWRNDAGHLLAMFDDGERGFKSLLPSRLPAFNMVYAMTIHKTQGSEFDHVVLALPAKSEHQLLSRELLYTGITRAKTRIAIASRENVWLQAVEKKVLRHSFLHQRIANLLHENH